MWRSACGGTWVSGVLLLVVLGGPGCSDESRPRGESASGGGDTGLLPLADAGSCVGDEQCPGGRCVGGACQYGNNPEDVGPADGGRDSGQASGGKALCAACDRNDECAGEGSQCRTLQAGGSRYCLTSCAEGQACPEGYTCIDFRSAKLCVPVSRSCDTCVSAGCPAGETCDPVSGACRAQVPRKNHCEPCRDNAECEGMCASLNGGRFCLDACEAQADCPAGSTCTQILDKKVCQPDSGACGLCAGVRCGGDLPICDPGTGNCVQCLGPADCPQGQSCANGRCRAQGGLQCPRGSQDCPPDAPICYGGICVQCLSRVDCPARTRCDEATNQCVADPCGGIECGAMGQCDPQAGRCNPGCRADADCGSPELKCNLNTGQCYNPSGECDENAPCVPGSECVANPLGGGTACSCESDGDFLGGLLSGGGLVPCQCPAGGGRCSCPNDRNNLPMTCLKDLPGIGSTLPLEICLDFSTMADLTSLLTGGGLGGDDQCHPGQFCMPGELLGGGGMPVPPPPPSPQQAPGGGTGICMGM